MEISEVNPNLTTKQKMNWVQLLSSQRADGRTPERHATRSYFEQDYDRIIFSYAFRRLQDKTQVFPMPKEDFVHSRLTHSLEVSSVARSLGKRVGEVLEQRHPQLMEEGLTQYSLAAIVAAAALAHDLGNPPFGHCGETAISDFFRNHPIGTEIKKHCSEAEWADLTNFEGNSQGFRILNTAGGDGLKLTYATLAAFSKYPCQAHFPNRNKKLAAQKKYGFFQAEQKTFQAMAEATGMLPLADKAYGWHRHPLTFLVEAADDICYHLIDLEDGCRLGLVSYKETRDLIAPILGDKYRPEKLDKLPTQEERIGVLRAMAIGLLIEQCADAFLKLEEELLTGECHQALTDAIPATPYLDRIKDISVQKIYRAQVVLEREMAGFEVLGGLLEQFVIAGFYKQLAPEKFTARHKSALRLLPEIYRPQPGDSAYSLTLRCLDFVSGMTDGHAVNLYRKIKGSTLAGF
jgi:dGTPase